MPMTVGKSLENETSTKSRMEKLTLMEISCYCSSWFWALRW